MPLAPLDVIVIFDGTVIPPKPKIVVCISPADGYFFRINSKPWPVAVELLRLPNHPFLDHNSYLQCDGPLELDDYTIDEALRQYGIIGKLDRALVPDILAAVDKRYTISQYDKDIVRAALTR